MSLKHNSYFDGKVQSLGLDTEKGNATVGVITPGAYAFSTSTEERMRIVSGALMVKLPGKTWEKVEAGNEFIIEANASFDVEASRDVAYICYYK
jgi:purine/pyrimidine-nucleoside phosphorylase